MDGLQRAIEEPRIAGLQRIYPPTSVGSLSIIGFAGLTTSSTSLELRFPPVQQVLRRLSGQVPSVVSGFRSRELEWRRTHPEALGAFANEWVALEGEQIVAHGKDALQVVTEARARGIQTPYVFFVESPHEDVIKMGL
jgi:hypothetical protein